MKTKVCKVCLVEKSLDDFHKDRSRKAGVFPYCKSCSNAQCRERLQKMSKREDYKQRRRLSANQYRNRYPEKQEAHSLARKVPLAKNCEECGSQGKLHKHHPDYSKPLEVISLCIKCHTKAHHGVIV